MLSRRNIRVKVMQMLYGLSRDADLEFVGLRKRYVDSIQQSYILYLYNLLYLIEVAKYSRNDWKRRKAKHLPSAEDKQFTDKLYTNDLIQSIVNSEGLYPLFEKHKLVEKLDTDTIRKIYTDFSKTEDYQNYIVSSTDDHATHKKIILTLYKYCVNHDLFQEAIDDLYATWSDDKSLVVGTIKKTIKMLPTEARFFDQYRPSDETTKDFGERLLEEVCTRDAEYLEIIEPTLKNWDADRVAIIDMILLKMAVSELMIFSTIPTKVTLNEYVEISKIYSTEKSKDFINGILDRIMKKLNNEGKINKEGRGLVE